MLHHYNGCGLSVLAEQKEKKIHSKTEFEFCFVYNLTIMTSDHNYLRMHVSFHELFQIFNLLVYGPVMYLFFFIVLYMWDIMYVWPWCVYVCGPLKLKETIEENKG